MLQLHKEANQLEYELGRLETDLKRAESEIDNLERRIDQRDSTKAQLEEVKTEITELRTRIDRIEQAAIEEFNHHMETVLEMPDYANLNCIWVERVEREVREGRRKVSRTIFELHVIRKSSPGVTYEDTVAHLSESEREVTGIVFALAGYLCHEVYEELPFMLLDSLEASMPSGSRRSLSTSTTTQDTYSSRCYRETQLHCQTSISELPRFSDHQQRT